MFVKRALTTVAAMAALLPAAAAMSALEAGSAAAADDYCGTPILLVGGDAQGWQATASRGCAQSYVGAIQIKGPGVDIFGPDVSGTNQTFRVSGKGAGTVCAAVWQKRADGGYTKRGSSCTVVRAQ